MESPTAGTDERTGKGPGQGLPIYFLLGVFLGVIFVKSEVASWFRIQEMFRFQAFHMYGVIGSAVATGALSLFLMKRAHAHTMRGQAIVFPAQQERQAGVEHALGGTIFGLGWGRLGACPGPIYALMGAGVSVMVVGLLGAVAGAWVYGFLRPRLPHGRPRFLGLAPLGVLLAVTALPAQQPDRAARLMEELTNAPGPSGFEGPVREIVERELRTLGATIEHDGLGSVLATLPGAPADGPVVMVTAHMDEVGLMVQYVNPDGFIRVKTLGGILDQALPDQRWTIVGRNGPVLAVSGLRTVHVTPPAERGQVWPLEQTFLDVGARSREEVEAMGIRPGDPVAPWSPFTILPNGRYAAKGWDDRVGLAVMLEAARRIREDGLDIPARVVWVATVQEEIGLRGAETAVVLADPDLGISIEAGVSADYPGARPEQAQERLGAGAGIFLLDSSMIPNTKLRDFFFDVAREEGIGLQPDVLTGYGEDGALVQRHDSGRPSVNMTVPTRYLHAHTGIIQRSDFDQAVDLLLAVLGRLDAATVERLSSF